MIIDQTPCEVDRASDEAGARAAAATVAIAPDAATLAVGRIPLLDGLRALSFLTVFAGHVGLERFVPGGFGVTVFFFLSGFLITTLMRAEFSGSGALNLSQFWLRRALRILPPFYLILLGATLMGTLIDPAATVSGHALAARALHITNYWLIFRGYDGEPPGTGVYWSLAVEEHFYLLFPWIYLLLQKLHLPSSKQATVLWGLCALVLLWRCVLVLAWHASSDRTYMGSDTRIDSILFGCALAVWKNPVLDRPVLPGSLWKYVLVPVSMLVLAASLLIPNVEFRETFRYSLQGVALTVLFIAIIRFRDSAYFRLLSWRPIAFVGVLSYSLYLLHYAVILGVRHALATLHPALQALIALAISMALAWIVYLCVEQPCGRLRRRLHPSNVRKNRHGDCSVNGAAS